MEFSTAITPATYMQPKTLPTTTLWQMISRVKLGALEVPSHPKTAINAPTLVTILGPNFCAMKLAMKHIRAETTTSKDAAP